MPRVVVPFTSRSPVMVALSLIVTSDVLCPMVMGTPEVAVPSLIPSVVSVVSMVISLAASTSMPPASETRVMDETPVPWSAWILMVSLMPPLARR